VNFEIRGVGFVTNLIILESKGIDVILGMDWLSKHKVLIDYAKKSVKLTTLKGKEVEIVAELVVTAKGVANLPKVNWLDASQGSEVPVVNEFPDVFLKELPGMPPDQDIEFVIELKPSTTPIYKTPYRMATPELDELKKHIKELLEKGFIHPSSSHGEPLWFLSRRRMVPKGCAWIIVPWMRLPSRTSTSYLGLMIYSINSLVHVCSLRLIFDWDIIS
jgi:hypothetical protein